MDKISIAIMLCFNGQDVLCFNDIAKKFNTANYLICNKIKYLVEQNVIEETTKIVKRGRKRKKMDKRFKYYKITEKGKKLIAFSNYTLKLIGVNKYELYELK